MLCERWFTLILLVVLAIISSTQSVSDCVNTMSVMVPQERCVTGQIYENHMLSGGLWGKNFIYIGKTANIEQCVRLVCKDISSGFAFLLNGTFCYSVKCLESCKVDVGRRSGNVNTMTVELQRKVFFSNKSECVSQSRRHANDVEKSGEYRILRDVIRKANNIDVRPAFSSGDRTNMTISIRLAQILDVDEIGQTITMNVWTTQAWENPLLKWEPETFDNVTTINVEPNMVWTPGVVLHNNAGDQPSGIERQKTKVIIESNGKNLWYATTLIKSQCKINTRYFPFDEQICYLILSSWTLPYRKFDLHFSTEEDSLGHYINNSEWEVLSFTVRKRIVLYPCCKDPYAEVLYRLHIQRKTLYYIYTMIIPCTVITALVAMGFFLPPSSGERITLNVTILVAITVYLNIASKKLPTTSENIPLLSTFYFLMVIQVAISIMATTLVLRFHFRGSLLGRMPKSIRYILVDCLGRVLCGLHYKHVYKTSNNRSQKCPADARHQTSYNGACVGRRNGTNERTASTIRRPSRSMETIPLTSEHVTSSHSANDIEQTPPRMDYQMRCMSLFQMQRDNKGRVTEDISTIVQAEKRKTKKKELLDEWQFAAIVVDRLFFILSLFAVVACTATMMLRPRMPIVGSDDDPGDSHIN